MNVNTRKVLVAGKMCMPCKQVKEWIEEHNINDVEILYGEDNMDFCRYYGVCKTPTLVVITQREGSEYEGNVKIDTPEEIIAYLEGKADEH